MVCMRAIPQINAADLEHYYGGAVLRLAYLLSKREAEAFSALSYRTRKRWLDRSVDILRNLTAEPRVNQELSRLTKTVGDRQKVNWTHVSEPITG